MEYLGEKSVAGARSFGQNTVRAVAGDVRIKLHCVHEPCDAVFGAVGVIDVAGFPGQVVEVFGDNDAHGMDVGIGNRGERSTTGIPGAAFEGRALRSSAEAVSPEVFVVSGILEHVEIERIIGAFRA